MSLKIKVDRNYIRYLLDKLKFLTNQAILSFDYDKVKIIINDNTLISIIDIECEACFSNYLHNEDEIINAIIIRFDPRLLLLEIDQKIKRKYIQLSFNRDDNFMKVKSTD